MSRRTEISLGRFVSEHFTSLTLDIKTWVISDEDTTKSFWISRPDDWMVNRKIKKIILLEFKRTSDYSESYYRHMWRGTEQQHTPITSNGVTGVSGRSRMGGTGCPSGRRTVVSQRKGVTRMF